MYFRFVSITSYLHIVVQRISDAKRRILRMTEQERHRFTELSPHAAYAQTNPPWGSNRPEAESDTYTVALLFMLHMAEAWSSSGERRCDTS